MKPLTTATAAGTAVTPPFTMDVFEDGSTTFRFEAATIDGAEVPAAVVTLPAPHLLAIYAAVEQVLRSLQHHDQRTDAQEAPEVCPPEPQDGVRPVE